MLRFAAAIVTGLCLVVGCGGEPHPRSRLDQRMFGPASIRVHPTFTQVRDWTGNGKPDGIEATLEVEDQFGDPTRTTGKVIFELYSYRKDSADVRGKRIGGPWISSLDTRQQQEERWNSALRSYTFQLHFPQITKDRYYVLTAQLDLNGQAATTRPASNSEKTRPDRLFAQLIIEPQTQEKMHGHYRAPHVSPGR
ncbi:MAG TPA: hypothetical protein VN541_04745 [Tepidisphaeraceae bacterium]|nr:hypothetical protein [Tepidisphaeraceae bacterium]